jgi:enoyl-CoA hydratase/carnithine racemase
MFLLPDNNKWEMAVTDHQICRAPQHARREAFKHALPVQMMKEVVSCLLFLDRQHSATSVIILTGAGDKAFAAGIDIKVCGQTGRGGVRGRHVCVHLTPGRVERSF